MNGAEIVGVIGAVLAASSIAWQVVTYRLSGAQLEITTHVAQAAPALHSPDEAPDLEDVQGEDDSELLEFPIVWHDATPILVTVIRNRGRTSIQVLECELKIRMQKASRRKQVWMSFPFDSDEAVTGVLVLSQRASVINSPALPFTLAPNSTVEWALYIANFAKFVLAFAADNPKAYVEASLGTGRRKRVKLDLGAVLAKAHAIEGTNRHDD